MKLLTPVFISSTLAFSAVPSSDSTTINVVNRDNMPLGTISLSEAPKGTKIILDLKNLPPGEHAIHFHEKGECLAPEFKTAGEHYSPTAKDHGHKAKNGPHAGDMKNVTVSKDGTLKTEIINAAVSLKKEAANSLLKAGGTAFVIHAKADDYKTQPSGNSGDRIACAVIR